MLIHNYYLTLLLHNLFLASLCWLTGLLVAQFRVKVNYTRKINHFALLVIPVLLSPLLPYEPNAWTISCTAAVFVVTTLVFIEPIRSRFSMVQTAFSSIDRPEDQPYTLIWIITQALASYAVLVALFFVLRHLGMPELVVLPILITGLGDGLAEPVGVRFGKHKYAVPSLAKGRTYTRSWEGSACVLVVSALIVIAFSGQLSTARFTVLLIGLPIVMTLTEAVSPHSWDAPMLYAAGGAFISLTLVLV